MACPQCDVTMQGLCGTGEDRWFWCPSCGTVKQGQQSERYEVPTFIRNTKAVAYLFSSAVLQIVRNGIVEELTRRGGVPDAKAIR